MDSTTPTFLPKRHFDYRMTHSVISGNGTFPFAVTTAAARNPQYETENRNSQDAVGICAKPHFVVGLVCDGCTRTHPAFEQHSGSSNEVGAKLACNLILRDLDNILERRNSFRPDELIGKISRSLLTGFRATVKAFCGRDEVRSEKFIYDYLMTTVVGFVVTAEQFVVFYSGDGVVAVDGKLQLLEPDADGVHYFSNELLTICCPQRFQTNGLTNGLKVHVAGETKNLQSIFVATDGMAQFVRQYPDELSNFLMQPPMLCNEGFDFALPEFRHDIAWNPKLPLTLTDDAAFALVRRISQSKEAAC